MSQDSAFVYEGLLVGSDGWSGAAAEPASPLADYCSVEGIVSAGEIAILGVSDRFLPEPPFRETGVVFPSCRPAADLTPAVEVAKRLVPAIGMVSGAFHIEVKLTAGGPVVIEANPRPGGPVPHMWERLTGRSFVSAYLEALHGDVSGFRAPLAGACGEHLLYPPGEVPGRIASITGLESLPQLACVDAVDQWLVPGDLANPHEGDYSAVARAWSWAPDPVGVAVNDRRIRDSVQVDLIPAAPLTARLVGLLQRAG